MGSFPVSMNRPTEIIEIQYSQGTCSVKSMENGLNSVTKSPLLCIDEVGICSPNVALHWGGMLESGGMAVVGGVSQMGTILCIVTNTFMCKLNFRICKASCRFVAD
jgi:hypothetical protein